MRKAFALIISLLLIAGGTGYYFWDQNQKRVARERFVRDSLRQARDLENARLAALEKAHRDSLAEYEKTHSRAVVRAIAEKLINDEMMSGRNHVGGKNWSERINILREQCENVLAYDRNGLDSIFRSFSFKGLMGDSIHVRSDSITNVYHVTQDFALVDVHFDIGDRWPEGQNVTYRLAYEDEKWVIDDFSFLYTDGECVTESEEMKWFISRFGGVKEEEEETPSQ